MKRITNLLVVLVFMFNSTAIFAKAIEHDSEKQVNQNLRMLTKLEKKLEKEERKNKKSNLDKEVKKHQKALEKQYKLALNQIYKNVEFSKQEQALNKLENMKAYNLEKLNDLKIESSSYEDFLRSLLIEVKLNMDETGRMYQGSSQSVQATVLVIIAYVVGGVVGALLLFTLLGFIILFIFCASTDWECQ